MLLWQKLKVERKEDEMVAMEMEKVAGSSVPPDSGVAVDSCTD